MKSSERRLGAAKIDVLEASAQTAPSPGIGDAFSIERAAGRTIEKMRHACQNIALPTPGEVIVTYLFCDDLEEYADPGLFDEINIVWASDLSIDFSALENKVVLVSRNGNAGCVSKQKFASFSKQATFAQGINLANTAAIVFQLKHSKATIYPDGLLGTSFEHRHFGTVASLLNGNELDLVLNYFDDQWVNAPQGHSILWANIPKHTYVPCLDTEKVIQRHMQLALICADRSLAVVEEIWNAEGRADLYIYSDSPTVLDSVVLELKVLRSASYPEKRKDGVSKVANSVNDENAQEVVRQAARYKVQLKTTRALARLYDMRKPPVDPNTQQKATALAQNLGVELGVTSVHYTVKAKRNSKVSEMLAAAISK